MRETCYSSPHKLENHKSLCGRVGSHQPCGWAHSILRFLQSTEILYSFKGISQQLLTKNSIRRMPMSVLQCPSNLVDVNTFWVGSPKCSLDSSSHLCHPPTPKVSTSRTGESNVFPPHLRHMCMDDSENSDNMLGKNTQGVAFSGEG